MLEVIYRWLRSPFRSKAPEPIRSEAPDAIMLTDPERFLAIVRNDDTDFRLANLRTAADVVVSVLLRCGIDKDTATLPRVRGMYEEIVRPVPLDPRFEMYEHVEGFVSKFGRETVGALAPFILFDPDAEMVVRATIDYASRGSLTDGNPMSRPKDVLAWIEGGLPANRAAAIGGLLALGDPRVCNLVAPLRSTLRPSESRVITQCYPGTTAKCVVEFYLDWADELVEREDDDGQDMFGDVVAGLCRLAGLRGKAEVFDGLRPFPVPTDGEWPGVRRIEYDELVDAIADRLYDIEERERPPRIITTAMRAFDLEPSSP